MRRVLALAALLALATQALAIAVHPARAAGPNDVTFAPTGAEQTWVVPAGVTSIHVVLIGGHGGTANTPLVFASPVPGGFGARVTGDLTVTPGTTLFIEVGGAGGMAAASGTSRGGAGGFNGGAIGGPAGVTQGAGGGGGASDIRTVSRTGGSTLGSRLMVAAGGGGGGAAEQGGAGGDAGASGADSSAGDHGGGAGTASAGGAGGTGGAPGQAGTSGVGGAGAGPVGGPGGGGGGGGYFGGGGGADAAGGGGGSSYLGSATNGAVAVATAAVASIAITDTTGASPSPSPAGSAAPDSTVNVQFSVTSDVTCLELSTATIDFGSVRLGEEGVAANPDISVTNCAGVAEDVLARAADATATGATWSLAGGTATCADTLGLNSYRLDLQGTAGTVHLTKSNQALGNLGAGSSDTEGARLTTACPGSDGGGQVMTTQIVFLATTGG